MIRCLKVIQDDLRVCMLPKGHEVDCFGGNKFVVIEYEGAKQVDYISVHPLRIFRTSNEWNPTECWYLEAVVLEDGKVRLFAMEDIYSWKEIFTK